MTRRIPIRIIICLLAAILAFKFGSYIGNGEQANFPGDFWEWLLFTGWPCYLAPAFCGVALIIVAIICREFRMDRSTLAPGIWLLPILAGLVGLINTTESDFASQWMLHFIGAFAFCTATWLAAANDKDFLFVLAATIGTIGILAAMQGWYQHFIGLEEARNFAIKQMTEKGLQITPVILAKMEQTRIYGNYIDPNVYASHILFCMPFSLFTLYSAGRKMEQPKVSSAVLTSVGAVLFLCALFWSGSRGAVIGLAAGVAIAVWSLKAVRSWRWRWCLPALAALGAAALAAAFLLLKSRDGMASASARLDYYITAVRIFARHPFAGAGLGEFFPWYMRLKPIEAEITRDPHNILLSFMAQTGIVGLIVVLFLLLFPWLIATFRDKSLQDNMLQITAITALAAWLIHCLFQFNELFPGTLFLAAASTVFIITPTASSGKSDQRTSATIRTIAIATGAICLMAFMRVPGERMLRQGEILEGQNPGGGLPSFVNASVMLPNAIMPPRASYEIHYSRGEWSRAADAAAILVRRSPHRSSSHQRLALAQLAMNRLDEAEKSLAAALEWYPSSPDALIALAALQYKRNHSLSLMENSLLANQLRSCKAWSHDASSSILVTFEIADNSLLTLILKDARLSLPDGPEIVFQPEGQEQP